MTYKTLMVHLQLDGGNQGILKIAADLARRFNANVIGIAACQPIQVLFQEGLIGDEIVQQDIKEIRKELAAAESEFRTAFSGHPQQISWRSAITYGSLATYIADEARAADLIITGKDVGSSLFNENRRVIISDLVLQAGRPILLVPPGIAQLPLRHVFLAWNDSREARQAAVAALPLLAASQGLTVLEVAPHERQQAALARVRDVAGWLEQHGITARPMTDTPAGSPNIYLHARLLSDHCDLLVAGAYGHSRLAEWAFGGMTQDVLMHPGFPVLLCH